MTQLEREIREQPEAFARLLERGRDAVLEIAARIRGFRPRYAVLAARGSSDNAARYAQYLFGAHDELSVALAAPALVTHYRRPPRLEGALVMGISQSGRSPDIVAVVEEGRRQGALAVAVTNDPGSPLARAADCVLELHAGAEEAVAATKTYTTQLFALAMLSTALTDDQVRWGQLAALPSSAARVLDLFGEARAVAERLRAAERIVVLGRGFNLATAWEIALKLKETSYVIAEPYSWADFLHGPVAMLEPGFPVLLVAPSGVLAGDAADVEARLRERGAELVTIADRESATLRLPPLPEWLSPMMAAIPGQMLALALAQARGHDPDRPRGLAKVTLTT